MRIPQQNTRRSIVAAVSLVAGGAIVTTVTPGCGGVDAPPPARKVHSSSINVTIDDLPPAWEVLTNDAQGLVLAPTGPERTGSVEVTAGPEENGINLVAAVEAHQAEIESRDDGVYSGARELSGPLGAAYYSRGRFLQDGAMVEQTRIFALHPASSRLLVLDYTYPAAEDSSTRVSELIELFSCVE